VKVLLLGDPHIRHTHLTEGVALLSWIERLLVELQPDLLVNLGDTMDSHAVIRSEVLCSFDAHIRRVQDLNVDHVVVLGNHDMFRPNDATYHALRVFKGRKNLTIVDETVVRNDITYVPYLHDPKKWPQNLQGLVITHNTFVGADYGFKVATDGIDLTSLTSDLVVSGHIHQRQSLDGVLYVGTPMAVTAAEVDQVKGVTLIDSDTLETQFIASPFPQWRSAAYEIGGALPELNEHDRWVLTVKGTRAELKHLADLKSLQDLRRRCSMSIKIEPTDKEHSKRVNIVAPTVAGMVEQYIDRVYSGAVSKGDVKNSIKKALTEAGVE